MGQRTRRARHTRRAIATAVGRFIEQLEPRRLLAAAGPDGFGYVADSHPFEAINLVEGDAGVVTVMSGVDDESLPVDLGDNTFNFYGATYRGDNALFVSSNGLITFGQADTEYTNSDFSLYPYAPSIAPLWDDWIGAEDVPGQVLAKVEPDRLVLQWSAQHFATSPSTVTFQAMLQLNTAERPGDITFNYDDLQTGDENDNGAGATIGIKDLGSGGGNRLLISQDQLSPLVGDHRAILIHNAATGHPHADAGGPYQFDDAAADSIVLDASGSSDPDGPAAALHYAWDLDGDGVFGETGAADAPFGDEVGVHPHFSGVGDVSAVALRVTDSGGLSTFATAAVSVVHHPPTATVTGPATGDVGVPFTIHFSATGQGSEFFFQIDWGDTVGDPDIEEFTTDGSDTTATHTFFFERFYTISVTATDDQGATSGAATLDITIGPRPDVKLTDAGVLLVTTGGGNDTIVIDTAGGNARLSRNGTITTYALADVSALDIQSGGGNDSITVGLALPDSVDSGGGDDTIVAGDGPNTLFAGEGDDSIRGGSGDDFIDAGFGDNIVNCGDGSDTVTCFDGNDLVTTGPLGIDTIATGDGNDTIVGGEDGLNADGGGGDDSITGGPGPDTLSAGLGNASLFGGEGDDLIFSDGDAARNVGAIIDAGPGADDIVVTHYVKSVIAGDGNDAIGALFAGTIDCGAGDDTVRCGSDDQHGVVVFGDDGDDRIFTGSGRDSIYGGAGGDTVHAGSGADLLSGGGGRDVLFGQGGHDRLYGGAGDDRLDGQGGNDRFDGGSGADSISGGDGNNAARRDDPLDELSEIQSGLT